MTPLGITWRQSEFGHPGNWREDAARFCLETFLQIAPRIQEAKWIPSAIELRYLYNYKVTAREDNIEIWEEIQLPGDDDEMEKTKHKVGQLRKGESRTFSAYHRSLVSDWYDDRTRNSLTIVELPDDSLGNALGLSCVSNALALDRFPDLVEIPWKDDDETTEEQS